MVVAEVLTSDRAKDGILTFVHVKSGLFQPYITYLFELGTFAANIILLRIFYKDLTLINSLGIY